MKKALSILLVLITIQYLLCGCDPIFRYDGEHTDLASAAIYSIPGVSSHVDDKVLVLDEDEFGRVLYSVRLVSGHIVKSSHTDGILAVLILQKSDDSSTWFYGEKNYYITIIDEKTELTEQLVDSYFSPEKIEALKSVNDWNEPLNEDHEDMVQVPILLDKGISISSKVEKTIEEKIGTNIRTVYLRDDSKGNSIYFVLNILQRDDKSVYEWYAARVNSDKLVDEDSLIPLTNIDTIKEDLAEFIE